MGSLTTCWELDYLLERLTNLHVTRPQVHLQGITESSTAHHVTKGPVCIHLFQVLFASLNRDIIYILNSNMKFDNACKNVEPKIQS